MKLSSLFLSGSTFLQSVLSKKKASAKRNLPQSIPTTTEALLLFHGFAHVSERMARGWLHARLSRKMGCRIGVGIQAVTKAWSALLTAIEITNFHAAYSSYFLCSERKAMLQVLKSRSNVFLPLSQGEPIGKVNSPVSICREGLETAWVRMESMDCATPLPNLEFFKHLHALLENNSLYMLENEKR